MEQYKVLKLYEDDFGCEERSEDYETQVIVILESSDKTEISLKQGDAWMYEQDINEGDAVYLAEGKLLKAKECIKEDELSGKGLYESFEFRNIFPDEAEQAADIETICFLPNEACSRTEMKERVALIPELFFVAVDKKTGKIAGFLNGLGTDEYSFRDEFFSNAKLHNPAGENIMLLGLDVLPEYRGQGLAREIMSQYLQREREKKRAMVLLTCSESKVEMYKKFGFQNMGLSESTWGGEEWYEMRYVLNKSKSF